MTFVVQLPPKQHKNYIEVSVELDLNLADRILLECYETYIDIGGTFQNIFLRQCLVRVRDHVVLKQHIPIGPVCWSETECSPYDLAAQEWMDTMEIRLLNELSRLRNIWRCLPLGCDIGIGDLTTYTVEYIADVNGSISGNATQTVIEGSNTTTVTAVPSIGYSFVSWDDGLTTASRSDGPITEDLTFTATFEINEYTLQFNVTPGGTLTGDTTQVITHGQDGTEVIAAAEPGYNFAGWSDGVMTLARTPTNVTSSGTFTAIFEQIGEYTIQFNATAGGSIIGNTTQIILEGEDGTEVTAVADPGFNFVGWDDGFGGVSRTPTNVTSSGTFTAIFEQDLGPNHVLYGAPVVENITGSSGAPTLTDIQANPSLMDNLNQISPIVNNAFTEFTVTTPPPGQVKWSIMVAIPVTRGTLSDLSFEDPPGSNDWWPTDLNDFLQIEYNGVMYNCYRIQLAVLATRVFRFFVNP